MFIVKLISRKRNYFSIGKDHTEKLSLVVHSDTLFSAICNNFRKLYGNNALNTFLEQFVQNQEKNSINLKISSCFHYLDVYKDSKFEKTIYFLPKPLMKFPFSEQAQEFFNDNPKIFKKISFISLEIVRKLQNNEKISLGPYNVLNEEYLIDDVDIELLGLKNLFSSSISPSKLSFEKEVRAIRKKISLYNISEEEKVTINRTMRKSDPFTWSKLNFNPSQYYVRNEKGVYNYELFSGFYFLLDDSNLNTDYQPKIKTAIRLIIDEGLGGKKSIGCGLIDDVEFVLINEKFPYIQIFQREIDGYYTNISLVYPSLNDINSVEYYNLYTRSGFSYSLDSKSKRFNDVKFIEEGAIFNRTISGKLIQVAPDEFQKQNHKVYKNGIGFYVNVGKGEVKES